MSYTQKPLIELMKAGKIPGESTVPEHIETVISNLFLFPERVYKVYKNDNEQFNRDFRDIALKDGRFSFTRRDFAWNNLLSPSIYRTLMGASVVEQEIVMTEPVDASDELVIVMARVNTDDVLFNLLMAGMVSTHDACTMGAQLAEVLPKMQEPRTEVSAFLNFGMRIEDIRMYIALVPDCIGQEEAMLYCDHLETFRLAHRERFDSFTSEMVRDGDCHSHNALYSGGKFYLMDSFPPKEEWGYGHYPFPLYRIGVDMWALSGKGELFEAFIEGYERGGGRTIDRWLDQVYVFYVALIATPYLYILSKSDPSKREAAVRYHGFVKAYFEKLNN